MSTLLLAAGLVFLAEIGDKSQLIALTLAARRPPAAVLAGLALAALVLQGAAAVLGAALGEAVPASTVAVVAGLGFLVAAAMVLRAGDDEPDVGARRGATVLVAFAALLTAELGDKTMIATAALAAHEPPVWVWLGGTAGFVLADGLAVLLGVRLFRRLPVRTVRLASAALLAVVGVVLLVGAAL